MVSRYSKGGKKFFGCSDYPNCKYVAWSLDQARNPEKYADQIAASEERLKQREEDIKNGVIKPVKETKAKKVVKKKTTKTAPKKKTAAKKASAKKVAPKSTKASPRKKTGNKVTA